MGYDNKRVRWDIKMLDLQNFVAISERQVLL